MNAARDDFLVSTKLQIAKHAGWLCSYPSCRKLTVGGGVSIGTAAHICAAASGGPRFDAEMPPEERRSASNGIWMCRDHGTAIDSDPAGFPVEVLRGWKKDAEIDARRSVLHGAAPSIGAPTRDALRIRLREAAAADLAVFRNTSRWPRSAVALTLEVEGVDEPASTTGLAAAARMFDDLILIASPGMGKTTTLLQIAEGVMVDDIGIPIFVGLGDWATEGRSLLEAILARPAFHGVVEADLRGVMEAGDTVLLLDGWNEIDREAREKARLEVELLKAGMPKLSLVVSTRKQARDVPVPGMRVELLPLNETQQLEIARQMRADAGAAMLDRAWRTPGIRELVPIPLYLTALLSLPDGAPFPETREEMLRRFVEAHEADPRRATRLDVVVRGFQQYYLDALAVMMTTATSTAIGDVGARKAASATSAALVAAGQIASIPEPGAVVDVFVDSHMLLRSGDAPGVSFQHQQFQEWYASNEVERRIIAAVHPCLMAKLQAEILNEPTWEEAILFAVERMSRGPAATQDACGVAILAAFKVDPMLAAEMIDRSTNSVWSRVANKIVAAIDGWHAPGQCDRALRFMLNSGRPEFLDSVWPLISHDNDQVSLRALRNCRSFRLSVLGSDAKRMIRSLAPKPREVLLDEIAGNGGIDGLDLATELARTDPNSSVQAAVAEALHFRRADRHLTQLLTVAADGVLDRLVAKSYELHSLDDEVVRARLAAARTRAAASSNSPFDKLRSLALTERDATRAAEVAALVASIEIGQAERGGRDAATEFIHLASRTYPAEVAQGLLERLRLGHPLFHGADDLLASSALTVEDQGLVQIALSEDEGDGRADAASSVLGPDSAGSLVDALAAADTERRDRKGVYDKAALERFRLLTSRIGHIPGASLVAAVETRAAQADEVRLALFASLLSRPVEADGPRLRPFAPESWCKLRELAAVWGDRMIAKGDVPRHDLAEVATLIERVPDESALPVLQRLLDHNLERYGAVRAAAEASGWRPGPDLDQARSPMTHQYMRAFLAIDAPETRALMRKYLTNPHFGELAARVLVAQWVAANDPPPSGRFLGGSYLGHVKARRREWAADPAASCEDADAIFAAVDILLRETATEEQRKLGAELATIGVRLPHGRRAAQIERAYAHLPRRQRTRLGLNLVLSGEAIRVGTVVEGIQSTLAAAAVEPWILMDDDSELRDWLQLLPFADDTFGIVDVVRSIPPQHRRKARLEGLVGALASSPCSNAGVILFELAKLEPSLHEDYRWGQAALQVDGVDALRKLIDAVSDGRLGKDSRDLWARELGTRLADFPDVRREIHERLRADPPPNGLVSLAHIVAEALDEDGVIVLVELEQRLGQRFIGHHDVQDVVTERVLAPDMHSAYELVPAAAPSLRRCLFALTQDTPCGAAARTLTTIDIIRDEHGAAPSEPRHPDLTSNREWPVMTRNAEAELD